MYKTNIVPVIVSFLLLIVFTGCSTQPEIIDLDKVLDIMKTTLDELNLSTPSPQPGNGDTPPPDTMQPLTTDAIRPEYDTVFLKRFSENLNAAKLTADPIGVAMLADGSVEGFRDTNANDIKDPYEKSIFKIEIDTERNRLIATDTQNNYRRSSGYSMMHGMFAGYFLSSMFGRQHHAGISPSRFANMKMSDNNYRKSAFSRFRSSARSKGGSRSFRSGK